MAINDVRYYYYTMLSQYLEEKQNLEDFSEALKDGHISEEKTSGYLKAMEDHGLPIREDYICSGQGVARTFQCRAQP